MAILDLFNLQGKRALITGGSRGLGKAMGQALAECGAELVLVGRTAETLEETRIELAKIGPEVTILTADLFDNASTQKMCETVLANHGPIDILINNVGGRRENIATDEFTLEDWTRLMDMNLTSAFLCSQAFSKPMRERGWGRIINIASICGQIVTKNIEGRHYETAKAAMVALTKCLGADWAKTGVTVNAIAPGGFMTDANRRWFQERPDFQAEVESWIPMGRLGEPEELGTLAVYLASDASRYMTGATLIIDGGYTLW